MKFSYYKFLSAANARGNKKSTVVVVLTCALVIACTVISCFASTTQKALNEYKEDYKARATRCEEIPITDEDIANLNSIEHVESVDDIAGLESICRFEILDSQKDDGSRDELDGRMKDEYASIYVCGLVGDEKKTVIAGEDLDSTPVYSCLVPHLFFPFEDEAAKAVDLDYIDGTTLIGKTLTVCGDGGTIDITYNYEVYGEYGGNDFVTLDCPEFKLRVVGTYYSANTASGMYQDVYVSRETDLLMTQEILEYGGVDLTSEDDPVARWWNDPTLHSYYVVADDYDNMTDISNAAIKMGYLGYDTPEQWLEDNAFIMESLFGTVGSFLTAAVFIITIIVLIQASIASVRERKGQIGLLKAMGYKDGQIFLSMCLEQLIMTFKGFLIGGAVSTVFIAVTNYMFEHGAYNTRMYLVDWSTFVFYLFISLAAAIIVPLMCQIILQSKMKKIAPKEAMN